MKNNKVYFSGMLNQPEFIQRYTFTTQRIANGFTRIDMGFLLGRSTYDIIDFEQLCDHGKMNFRDHEITAGLFKKPAPPTPLFVSKMNDVAIAHEKRLIRGVAIEDVDGREMIFSHPWAFKKDSDAVVILESLVRCTDEDMEIKSWVNDRLKNYRIYFIEGCTGLFLYQELTREAPQNWKKLFTNVLVSIVYDCVHSGKLQMCIKDGRILYKSK